MQSEEDSLHNNSTEVQVSNRTVKSLANSTNSRNTEPPKPFRSLGRLHL